MSRDETLSIFQTTETSRVILYASIPGATIYLETITPEKLRELANKMEHLRGIPTVSDATKIRQALALLEAYDSHADDCWCDLCRAIGILEGSYILQEAVCRRKS